MQKSKPQNAWLLCSILPMTMLLTTGCATPSGGCDLLPLKSYTPEFNMRLADERAAAPRGAAWRQAVVDYADLRDLVRACKGD